MPRILMTAFEPFLEYRTNASEQILRRWTRDYPSVESWEAVTQVLPVDYALAEPRVRGLAAEDFDFVVHLGQSAQIKQFALEAVALNLKQDARTSLAPLDPAAPAAYISTLPLEDWAHRLNGVGIPAKVSLHAGSYLCNATYFWSLDTLADKKRTDRALFVHVPLLEALAPTEDQALDLGSRMLSQVVQLVQAYTAGRHFGTA